MVAIKKVLNSSSNVGIVTLETYCFVSYFGVESDLLLSFFFFVPEVNKKRIVRFHRKDCPLWQVFFHPIFTICLLFLNRKTYHAFVSYGFF